MEANITLLEKYLKNHKDVFDYSFNFYGCFLWVCIKGKKYNLTVQEISTRLRLFNIPYKEIIRKYDSKEQLNDLIIK